MASSSSNDWDYDVYPSFSGADVRGTFLAHFLNELDRKLISAFKDDEIDRSQSLAPVLRQAIRNSRIAVVILSENYASSTWCLNELLEIFKCKAELGQLVIPVFYGVDPSHVRKQTGKFGEAFEKTCLRRTEDEASLWRQSLTEVANLLGYHSQKWPNETKMIEAIVSDVLFKLNVTPSKDDFEDFVGMDDHFAKMRDLLDLESQEVRMTGIWGTSGIGKTSIARALFTKLSCHFKGSIYIDRAFVSKSMEIYKSANLDDYNTKLHLLSRFLSEILEKEDIKIRSLGAIEERLKHQKVLIVIDDLEDQMVLDTLVGQTQWFGSGSRIIVITKDKQFLRAHGIVHIYEVPLPSKELALQIFCKFCFRQNFPPDGFMKLASEVVSHAGNLPLRLKVLGSDLRGRDKEEFEGMLLRSRNGLDLRKFRSQLGMIIGYLLVLFFSMQYFSYKNTSLLGEGGGAIDRIAMDLPKVVEYSPPQRTEITIDKVSGANPMKSSSSDAKTNADMLDSKAKPPQIQVFINFRGDIRNNFVGYLMDALQTREINVYIDNHEPRGEDLNTLFKTIENSGIAIVVFSTRYTESKWCLEELVKIEERVNQTLLKVLPIFYKVTPTNVKRLKGEFGDHFRDKEDRYGYDSPMIKRWKEAIVSVSRKFALVYDEKSSEQESKFVKTIVQEVLRMLQDISTVENGQSSCNPSSCGVSQS